MTLIIAGERSGAGKTTITLALLAGLQKYSQSIQSFKVGPDYIDPMFHQYITDRAARNLDPILTTENYVRSCFHRHSQAAEYALVEGVMGLFDGVITNSQLPTRGSLGGYPYNSQLPTASTAHIAHLLDLPIALVVDCSKMSYSVAAIVHGYRSLHPELKFAGVFLNRVGSDRHLELLENALEPLSIPILGVLRRHEEITIPDRHLGLIPTMELPELDSVIRRLADLAANNFNWELLLPQLRVERTGQKYTDNREPIATNAKIPIAVARDRAFNFYYQDNLDLLVEAGAELIYWSPLAENLPPGVRGLYFGGGFPEVFAAELAENLGAREAVATAIRAGIPTYAECGGLMYLCQHIIDFEGKSHPMLGILPAIATMERRLTLGYRQATVLASTPLLTQGMQIRGHEFHRSSLTTTRDRPLYQLQNYARQPQISTEGWYDYNLHASYLHIHFGQDLGIPQQFIQTCQQAIT